MQNNVGHSPQNNLQYILYILQVHSQKQSGKQWPRGVHITVYAQGQAHTCVITFKNSFKKSQNFTKVFQDPSAGMAYQFIDISVKQMYQHFLKCHLSVSVKVKINQILVIGYWLSVIGFGQISAKLWDFPPDISVISDIG